MSTRPSRPNQEIQPLLELAHVSKDYPTVHGVLPILSDVTAKFERGDAAAIIGPSGSGKSTFTRQYLEQYKKTYKKT